MFSKIKVENFDDPCPMRRMFGLQSQMAVLELPFDWVFQGKTEYIVRDPYKLKPYCVIPVIINIAKEKDEICLVEHRFDRIVSNSTIIKLLSAKDKIKYPPTKIIIMFTTDGVWQREEYPISLHEYKYFEKEVFNHAKNINSRSIFPFRSEKCKTCEFYVECKEREASI